MNVIAMEKCAIPLMSIIKTHNLSADMTNNQNIVQSGFFVKYVKIVNFI